VHRKKRKKKRNGTFKFSKGSEESREKEGGKEGRGAVGWELSRLFFFVSSTRPHHSLTGLDSHTPKTNKRTNNQQ
jgi:hypothetical protein